MITVDEALEYAQNALERAFEDWLDSERPSGDCESVQRQWDESFAHLELVDELQPVLALTWEVCQLQAENDRLRIENAALRADSARIDWLADVNNTVGSVVLPRYIVEQNISSLRQAIDAARSAKTAQEPAP